jgi:predicted nucleic acid-binding Zn ribbon protein
MCGWEIMKVIQSDRKMPNEKHKCRCLFGLKGDGAYVTASRYINKIKKSSGNSK